MRKGNFAYDRAAFFHVAHGFFGGAAHFGIELLPIMFARASQAKFAERLFESGAEILDGPWRGSWVERIAPRNQAQKDGCIGDAARHRADMIERRRKRHGAENADAAERRLQSDSPAKRGRHADRPTGV